MKKKFTFVRFVFVLAFAVFVAGCSGGGGSPEPSIAVEPDGTSALSNVEAADERAAEWNGDARLYAIAAATPQIGAEGNAPAWLYTYVSGEAGAVATVSVEDGTVAMDPEQELPEADIEFLNESALPPPDELLDSTEAIDEAEEVRAVLEENPASETAAGLDAVSGGEPMWRFSTLRGEERVEEAVPAVAGSGV